MSPAPISYKDFMINQQNEIKLYFDDHKVGDIIAYSLKPFEAQFKDKTVQLDIYIPNEDILVSCDIEKTVWVFMNLVGNALRYSPRWSKVILKAIENKENNQFIEFSVKDSGEGIPPDRLENIFHSFIQSPRNENPSGMGMALTLSKEIIEAQGGRLLAQSQIGEGSLFHFTLPISSSK